MEEWPTVRLTKKVFSNEPHRSKHKAGADLRHLRDAVLAAGRVSAFFSDYQAGVFAGGVVSNVMPRDATQLLTQMVNQTLFVCERTHPDPSETQIMAASVLWEHEVAVPSADSGNVRGFALQTFLEFGTQVSVLPGYRLRWAMTAVAMLERLLFDPTGTLVAFAFGDNTEAARSLEHVMRFVRWSDPPATWDSMRLLHLREDGQEGRGVSWFRPTLHSVKAAASLILDLCDNPVRESSRPSSDPSAGRIRFEFDEASFQLVSFDVIRALAKRILDKPLHDIASLREAVGNRTVSADFIVCR